MTNNRNWNIALSLIVAFCGWLYVMYNVDPTTTRTYREVPVTFTNEESLESNGIALKSVSKSSIQVTLTGKRSELNQLKAKNIKVVADLSDVGKGENTVKLKVKKPSDVSVESQSDRYINVNMESVAQKEVPIRVAYSEEATDESEPVSQEEGEETYTVIGAKTLVNRVKYVKAPVEESKLSDKFHTYNVSLQAVDYKGDKISYVRVSPSKTSVTVIKGTTKTVPLKADVVNPSDGEHKRTYELVSKVTIKGTEEAVKSVKSIRTRTIDLSNVNSSGRIAVECILPEGVELSNNSMDLSMTVNVTKYTTQKISFKTEDISVKNLNNKYKLTFEDVTLELEVTDTASKLSQLSTEDFTVSVDAQGVKSGEQTLKARVTCSEKLYKTKLSDDEIRVKISKKN